jgi:hypothetical protein
VTGLMRATPGPKAESNRRSGGTERVFPESRKGLVTRLIAENESVRLTNGLIALATRLVTSSILGIARVYQRNRSRW